MRTSEIDATRTVSGRVSQDYDRCDSDVTAARSGLTHRLRSPATIGAAGQIVYGCSNFLLLTAIAVAGSREGIGAASLVYLQVLFWAAVARASSGDVLLVRSKLLAAGGTRLVGGSLIAGLAVGLVGATATALLSLTGLRAGQALLFAISLPIITVYDSARSAFLARSEPGEALRGDVVWLGAQTLVTVALVSTGSLSIAWAVGAWSIGAGCALAVALGRLPADLRGGIGDHVRAARGIGSSLIGASALLFISRNLTYGLVGAVAGLAVLGDLRKALVVYSPLAAIFIGAATAMLPSLVRRPDELDRSVLRLAAQFAAFAAAWMAAAVILTRMGGPITEVVGEDVALVAWIGAALVFQGIAAAATAGFRAMGQPRYQVWTIASGLVCMVVLTITLVPGLAAAGGAIALVAGNGIEGLGALLIFVGCRRRAGTTPTAPQAQRLSI